VKTISDMQKFSGLVCLGLLGSPIYALNFNLAGLFTRANLIASEEDLYRSFLCQFLLLGVFYLIALRMVFRTSAQSDRKPWTLVVILFFACLYRLLLVPTVPALSTDIYRYIWDGRVQAHGINPYLHPPQSEALIGLRDEAIYPRINRPGSPTIYPAGAQILFHALSRLGVKSTAAFKGAVALFDMASILVLIMILIHLKLPGERVLVYAWHPLVIYELANNGHLDGFILFFVLLALLFLLQKRPAGSISSLALAASLKLYPIIILPALLREKRLRGCILFTLIFLSLYLPYLDAGQGIVGFLPEYFKNPNESFNLGLKDYLLKILPIANHLVITLAFAAALLAAAAVVWRMPKDDISAFTSAYILVSLSLVLASGSLHPWYLIVLIPFLALFPSPAWLYFSFAVSLSYLTYDAEAEWVRHIEYIPLFVLLTLEYVAFARQGQTCFPWRHAE